MKKLSRMTAYKIYVSLAVMAIVFPPSFTYAQTKPLEANVSLSQIDINSILCSVLANIGLGCNQASSPDRNQNSSSNLFSSEDAIASIFAPIFGGRVPSRDVLVRVDGQREVYHIVSGKRHLISSEEIFFDYGYKFNQIRPITQEELDRYPRASLLAVKGSEAIYYLTETGMIRLIPNDEIFKAYGNQKRDVVEVSLKELESYPKNRYFYQIFPLNRDIFEIVGDGKRYITPTAAQRLGIYEKDLAPVSQAELDFYKTLSPVL